ncbi:hypothetical protein TCAL_06883, partial [Tigriopus californicus]
ILWALTVLTSLILSGFFIAPIVQKFSDSPTYTTVANTNYPIWHLDFPAISICPNIRIDSKRLKEVLRNEPWSKLDKYSLDQVLPKVLKKYLFLPGMDSNFEDVEADMKSFVDQYHQYIPQLLRSSIYSCQSLFQNCKWQGIATLCSDLFEMRKTDLGYCCSFNTVRQAEQFDFQDDEGFSFHNYYGEDYFELVDYTLENMYDNDENIYANDEDPTKRKRRSTPEVSKPKVTRLRRTNSAGTSLGLSFSIVIPERSTDDYTIAAFDGFKVQIHSPYDFPEVEGRGLAVATNQIAFISVSASITRSTENVKAMNRDRRNCFLSDEELDDYYIADGVQFNTFDNYTQKSCLLECQAHLIFKECQCIPHYFPSFSKALGQNTTCNHTGLDCLINHQHLLNALKPDDEEHSHQLMEGAKCNCPQQCDETVYMTEFSQVPKSSSVSSKEAGFGNTSDVYVYFKQFGVIEFSRDQLFSLADLIGALGGIMGLFVGFSVLSGVELIYWFTLRLFNNH